MMKFLLTLLFLSLSVSLSSAENFLELRIPCEVGGIATAILPEGETVEIGRVKMIPSKVNDNAYTASKWASPSTVCATAVNAIHILVSVAGNKGRIISLVPSVTVAPAAVQWAFFSLDTEAGTGIFGGFAPMTGSSVSVEHEGNESALTDAPVEGDTLVIRSPLGASVYMADIENRPGGRVIVHGADGASEGSRAFRGKPISGTRPNQSVSFGGYMHSDFITRDCRRLSDYAVETRFDIAGDAQLMASDSVADNRSIAGNA